MIFIIDNFYDSILSPGKFNTRGLILVMNLLKMKFLSFRVDKIKGEIITNLVKWLEIRCAHD